MDAVCELVNSTLSLRNFAVPKVPRKMTSLRAKQIYKAFHGSQVMDILGFKDADNIERWIEVNGVEMVQTDGEML